MANLGRGNLVGATNYWKMTIQLQLIFFQVRFNTTMHLVPEFKYFIGGSSYISGST
jgi:hypothetical protein